MALKFLNKKGWHTGSLRNIENVWKAEQKHDAEQKKLEELRKQIHEERERSEFRQLQEQAGLVPKQERLDFLYDSGLAVGKGGSSFKELESLPRTDPDTTASSSSAATTKQQQSSAPGALFEEKPQAANDAWRKLHTDPLLLIRQREQEALARVKNNPVQMAMIRKSVEAKKPKEKNHRTKDEKKGRKKHHHKKSKHQKHSSSESGSDSKDTTLPEDKRRDASHHKGSKYDKPSHKSSRNQDEDSTEGDVYRKRNYHQDDKERRSSDHYLKVDKNEEQHRNKRTYNDSQCKEYYSDRHVESRHDRKSHFDSSDKPPRHDSNNRRRTSVKLSEEERAARLREMEMDAVRHEEQRWKRLKKAEVNDAREAIHDSASLGRNFLDAAQKSIYGAEKGGSSTIEESVRRRTHYLQGRSESEGNAFRR
ncbi:pre-mRNA-splicing factor CWC25 homolog isoform X1 [Olea europaea var. sylvestris]|uniref:CBF1-interacting co-repressor CIR N-terminal domain-containing protein n=1 Tax=Olea europaea subsp. europaea TaxID=158383 RepID=A0A8S0PYE8_OLEEU|nr:pre-mRNA-splicing factor CWC25 homolog isoform X1 [Olea europaea var. sylvestris]CAA2956630.1 Hypothetical predicted protein [Olea europaea subsp. europaea]